MFFLFTICQRFVLRYPLCAALYCTLPWPLPRAPSHAYRVIPVYEHVSYVLRGTGTVLVHCTCRYKFVARPALSSAWTVDRPLYSLSESVFLIPTGDNRTFRLPCIQFHRRDISLQPQQASDFHFRDPRDFDRSWMVRNCVSSQVQWFQNSKFWIHKNSKKRVTGGIVFTKMPLLLLYLQMISIQTLWRYSNSKDILDSKRILKTVMIFTEMPLLLLYLRRISI